MIPPHESCKKEFSMNQLNRSRLHVPCGIAFVAISLLLPACGVETATTAATVAKLQATQVKEAQEQKAQITQQLDQAQQQMEEQRKAMDDATK
jgi:hypothetical protein